MLPIGVKNVKWRCNHGRTEKEQEYQVRRISVPSQSRIRELLLSRLHFSRYTRGQSYCPRMYRLQLICSPLRLLRISRQKNKQFRQWNCLSFLISAGAPTGHTPAQAPHSTQASASITYFPSPSEIAPTGHSPAQAPHITQSSEIIYAIYIHLRVIRGASAPRVFIVPYLREKSIVFC